ncbi:MAG: hypothetical protein WDZ45_02310 [Flavobacteriaceae bacterium]
MHKASKISAFFFLGLFSLMLLHQIFPHLHHQHEDSHSDIAHSDEHHHHDNKQEKEEPTYGFFDLFMDVHSHSSFSSDIVVLKRNTVEQQTIVDKNVAKTSFNIQLVFLIDYWQNSKPPVYHPPNNYFNPYLSSLDLRGPPSLG